MVALDKADSRYKSLVTYLHEHISDSSYSKLNSILLKKGWPKHWIAEAHSDLLDEIHPTKKLNKQTKPVKVPSSISNSSIHIKHNSKDKVEVPTEYKSKLLSKLSSFKASSHSKSNKKTIISSASISGDLSRDIIESQFKTQEYLQKLLARKEKTEHFYERKKKTNYNSASEPSSSSSGSNKDFDVLKEAIKLAQDVLKSKPASQTVPVQVIPVAAPQIVSSSSPVPSSAPSSTSPVFPGGTKFDKSELDREFELQRHQLDAERDMLKKEREELFAAQKTALAEQTKALNLRVSSVNITTDAPSSTPTAPPLKPKVTTTSAVHPKTAHLENKVELLEEKLKNLDLTSTMDSKPSFQNEVVPDEVELVFEPVGDRAQTGIDGLDPIIQGGFRRLTSNMVAGGPGSGKTIFAMQYLTNGIEQFNEHGIYITFEQSKSDLYSLFGDMDLDLKKMEDEKKITIIRLTPHQLSKMLESGGGSLRDAIDSIHASRIVIDSVSDYLMLFKGDMGKRRACINMFDIFAKMKCTSLMVSEQEVSPLKHVSSVLEYQVDGVILLYNERVGDIRQRAIEIFKMRGTKHAGRIFPLKIVDTGVMILSDHPLNKK